MDILLASWPDWPEEWRDILLIVYCAVGIVVFFLMFFFILIVGGISTRTAFLARRILKDQVQPTMENVQATTATVRSTVTLVSEYAVTPVAKAYGTAAGARKFISVLARFRGRGG